MPMTSMNVADGVATIHLDNPESMNVLSAELVAALRQDLQRVSEDASIRCVVLTGTDKVFCAGGDLHQVAKLSTPTVRTYLRQIHMVVDDMRNLRKPIVAAVNGVAAGAGLSLALLADITVGCESSRYCTAFTGIGAVPDLNLFHTLPRAVGKVRAADMILTNSRLTAAEALQCGLISRLYSDVGFESEVAALARRLAGGPTQAYSIVRDMLDQASNASFDDMLRSEAFAQALAFSTNDFSEGVKAFFEKRPARFTGS